MASKLNEFDFVQQPHKNSEDFKRQILPLHGADRVNSNSKSCHADHLSGQQLFFCKIFKIEWFHWKEHEIPIKIDVQI